MDMKDKIDNIKETFLGIIALALMFFGGGFAEWLADYLLF